MLPKHLLSLTSRERDLVPRYLTASDDTWVGAVVCELAQWTGKSLGDRARTLKARLGELGAEQGIAPRLVEAMAYVLCRTYGSIVACPRSPSEVREVAFEEAARDDRFDRTAALDRAAVRLGLLPADIEASLFADRLRARLIVSPLVPTSAGEAMDAFNLSLVEGILACSRRIFIDVGDDTADVFRFAKRAGLLCARIMHGDQLRLDVSGPLSILRHTSKYSRALSRFFPALLGHSHLRLEAECLIRDEHVRVVITAADPLFRHVSLPAAEAVSRKKLARDIERLDRGWILAMDDDESIDATSFAPDFVLRRGADVVRVEIIRFHTVEHVRRRLSSVSASDSPTLLCIDESLACDRGALEGPFLKFQKKVDAGSLLAAVEALVRERGLGS